MLVASSDKVIRITSAPQVRLTWNAWSRPIWKSRQQPTPSGGVHQRLCFAHPSPSTHSLASGITRRNVTSLGQILQNTAMFMKANWQEDSTIQPRFQTARAARTSRDVVSGEEVSSKQRAFATLASSITSWDLGQHRKGEKHATPTSTSASNPMLYVLVRNTKS